MSKAPIEMMLDQVAYKPVEFPEGETPTELHTTHEGVLKIGEYTFRTYVLSDGRRVIDGDDMEQFFSGLWE